MHISELSIRRPVAVTMFFLAVVLLGIISFSRLSVDLFPDLQFPRLVVWTTYTNVSPEEVERFISSEIEQSVMTVPGIRDVHSVSREGVSLVTLEFHWDTNMEFAMLNVREKLDNLRGSAGWPREAGRPTILRADPNAEPVMSLSVSGAGGAQNVKGLAENVVKRRLEQIDGVALAAVTGGREREIQVEVDRLEAEALGIRLSEIQSALAASNRMSTGAQINRGRFKWYLRPVGEFQTIDDIRSVVVARRSERLVTVGDIAGVADAWRERDSVTRFNGAESIGLLIHKESGSNTSQVSAKVYEVLDQLEQEYTDLDIAVAFDQAEFIDDAISNVIWAIVLGGVLAFLVLFFFLHDVRNPINIGLAIPISIIATFALLYFAGISLNMMSLGGLALGVGLLVDNSIVVLENIFRHREGGEDRFEAAAVGAREVGMAVTASTFTTISVFLPIVFVEGVAGQLFRDQALTVAFSLLASLIVSLTLLPMLASRFLHMEAFIKEKIEADRARRERAAGTVSEPVRVEEEGQVVEEEPGLLRRAGRLLVLPLRMLWRGARWGFKRARHAGRGLFSAVGAGLRGSADVFRTLTRPLFDAFDRGLERFADFYHEVLEWSLDHRGRVLTICVALVGLSLWVTLGLDRRLMPQVDQGEFSVRVVMPPGSSLESTVETAGTLEGWLLAMPETEHVFVNAGIVRGQSALGEQDTDLNTASLRVRLKERRERSTAEVVGDLRTRSRRLLGAELTFNTGETTFTQILGTSAADLAVKVRGQALDEMQRIASEVETELAAMPGLRDIHTDFAVGKPEIRLSIERRVAEMYGLTVDDVVSAVNSAIRGELATEFQDFDRKVDVVVREDASSRQTLQQVLALGVPVRLQGQDGSRRIPLRELVEWRYTTGPNEVRRQAQNRQITVFASVEGRRLNDAISEVEQRMLARTVPSGYEIVVGGVNEEMTRSFRSLLFALLLAVLLVYMILAAQFESLIHPFTIMFAVPLAVVGVVLALGLFGEGINVMSLVGMVVLTGIVVNDAIIKVDFINQLRVKGSSLRRAIVEAGHYRLRPILMTTVTTVLGLLPMALGVGAGSELRSPLAVAVIGGLITATGLTLIVIPVIYSLMENLRGRALEDRSLSFDPKEAAARGEVRL
ncbi:MAG: efflux RND transporter permease subunit [bacterium]